MKIRIAGLSEGINNIVESIPASDLDVDDQVYPGGLNLAIKLDNRSGRFHVELVVKAEGNFVCDRCGDDFFREIKGSCQVQFVRRDQPLQDEQPGDELRSFAPGQVELDLSSEVRDALSLNLPIKKLCRDDCRGLCITCGANLNYQSCKCENN